MSLYPAVLSRRGFVRPSLIKRTSRKLGAIRQNRQLLTLAIETSCDDASVAILETQDAQPSQRSPSATLHFLKSITASAAQYRGIHPIVAHHSHQANLAKLVDNAIRRLPEASENDPAKIIVPTRKGREREVARRKPDFISVTRGPGMRASLITGLDTAKGLSVAWQVPLVGVHHMQAHLLTPQLVTALKQSATATSEGEPRAKFPQMSLLVSGGHSLIAHSTSPFNHSITTDTADMAIGNAIDRAAKLILPSSVVERWKTSMYGAALEKFAFPNGQKDYADYKAPASRAEAIEPKMNMKWGWAFREPFAQSRTPALSFSGILSQVQRAVADRKSDWLAAIRTQDIANTDTESDPDAFLSHEGRVALARDFMTTSFEHLALRTVIALEDEYVADRMRKSPQPHLSETERNKNARLMRTRRLQRIKRGEPVEPLDHGITTLVVSGGVASNNFLLTVLRGYLDAFGFGKTEIVAPPPHLCTDNAAMIGWTGVEMYKEGWSSDLGISAEREWSLDPKVENGGIFGVGGWIKGENQEMRATDY